MDNGENYQEAKVKARMERGREQEGVSGYACRLKTIALIIST